MLRQFLLLFIGAFCISLFVLMMQFLWRYVDDLIGKGLSIDVLGQFFWYMSLKLVPQAFPLAVLLSSLIAMGNIGENSELTAIKAAGISLMQALRSLIIFSIFVSVGSFYFQNSVGPDATKKLAQLLLSMRQKSPELEIPEGIFYDGIPNCNLYVQKKDMETGMLYGVMIYKMTDSYEDAAIILADSGMLQSTAEKQHLVLSLYNGEWFENMRSQELTQNSAVPYRRESFVSKKIVLNFDNGFNLADASVFSNNPQAKSLSQISFAIDSLNHTYDSVGTRLAEDLKRGYIAIPHLEKKDSLLAIKEAAKNTTQFDTLVNKMSLADRRDAIQRSLNSVQMVSSELEFREMISKDGEKIIREHRIEQINKFTLSLTCLIFFFIGAPLGGIIRKGGLGMPVVVSVLIFIIYYIINNTGYKMARDGQWVVWMGMWTSTAVLAPLGAFLTYKSNNDSVVLNADAYINWFKKVVGIRSVRHLFRKEVIIHDPDYTRIPEELKALSVDCREYADRKGLKRAPNYFKLWMTDSQDEAVEDINERLESLIDEMSNTRSVTLLTALNTYPVIPIHAHVRPFRNYWLNLLCGIVFPIGLFFYFRIWAFRIRLNKDMERIIKTNEDVIGIIERDQNK